MSMSTESSYGLTSNDRGEQVDQRRATANSPTGSTGSTGPTWLTMADGQRLFLRDWKISQPRGAVLIVHGLGEHSARYRRLAQWFNQRRYTVRSYDQRGHGMSPGQRGALRHGDDLLEDLATVYLDFAQSTQSAPLLLGHSMGGLVAARTVLDQRITPPALVLSSPALRSWESASMIRLARVTPRLADFIFRAGASCIADAKRLAVPTLLLVADSDELVDPAGSRDFSRAAASTQQLTTRFFSTLYHELFNEAEPGRSQVLMQLADWLGRRV
jgi:alpha-beta hydrolase superfamily lysophospholipase